MARRLLLVVAVSMSVLGLGARSPVRAGEELQAEATGPAWAPTGIGLGGTCNFSFDTTFCAMESTSSTAITAPILNPCPLRVSGTSNVTTGGIACDGFRNGLATVFDGNGNVIRTVPVVFEAASGSIA